MQFSTLFVTLLATAVVANPVKRTGGDGGGGGGGGGSGGDYDACVSELYSSPQCCATDVLGVADLDCATVSKTPSSAKDFQSICAAGGQRARCCVVPVVGQAVLCETPIGVTK